MNDVNLQPRPFDVAMGLPARPSQLVLSVTRSPAAHDVLARRDGLRFVYTSLVQPVVETAGPALAPVGAGPFRTTELAPPPPPVMGPTSASVTDIIALLRVSGPPPALPSEERLELAGVLLLIVAVVGAVISTQLWVPLMTTVGVACVAVLGFRAWQHRAQEELAPTRPTIFHDLDDPLVVTRAQLTTAVTQALAGASACWGIASSHQTGDLRRNAGAGTIVQRLPLRVTAWSPAPVNVSTGALECGDTRLAFWPDALVVEVGGALSAVAYEDLGVEFADKHFAEEGPRPADAVQDGRTWRYVCKDGSPDLRFANNVEIPWLVYGELRLSSPSGWSVTVQTSSVPAARAAADALGQLTRAGRAPSIAPTVPLAAPPPPPRASVPPRPSVPPRSSVPPRPSLPPRPSAPVNEVPLWSAAPPPVPHETSERLTSALVVLRSVAFADRRLSPEEVEAVFKALCLLCPDDTEGVTSDDFDDLLRSVPSDQGLLDESFRRLADAPEPWRRALVASAHLVARADDKVTPKERERLLEIERNLLPEGG